MTEDIDTTDGGEQQDPDELFHPETPQWVVTMATVGLGSLLLALGTALTLGGTHAVVSIIAPAASTPIPGWQVRTMALLGVGGLFIAICSFVGEELYRDEPADADDLEEASA